MINCDSFYEAGNNMSEGDWKIEINLYVLISTWDTHHYTTENTFICNICYWNCPKIFGSLNFMCPFMFCVLKKYVCFWLRTGIPVFLYDHFYSRKCLENQNTGNPIYKLRVFFSIQ